eukprot:CAMPEP_0183308420 /NCGR_PEP_ID=MMETSP0160_2-20130417/21927_1 /TAXON_ID=2839 ORGANISM="Odontella Sinensis, Strain Grunow 1884" /NCGR_SAMPLE_ID=MMETSP0160_2 /ASSEMBLY_ACC=CAM_ASM_000250 /LENGTH=312 /DNA_ID=CAMNT_0025472261 /DNA_START=35 /DNA_END=973 /DNA_ORIENTATION=+
MLASVRSLVVVALLLLAGIAPFGASGFLPASDRRVLHKRHHPSFQRARQHPLASRAVGPLGVTNGDGTDADEGGLLSPNRVNVPWAAAWVGFIAYAYARTAGEAPGATNAFVEPYFSDVIHRPEAWPALFFAVWNYLGLVPLLMASLIIPSSGGQKIPAAPFLFGSAAGGYGVLGLYMSLRDDETAASQMPSKADLGWFGRNVFENKACNWLFFITTVSNLFTSDLVSALSSDPARVVPDYIESFQSLAIVGASSADLAILTVTAACLIPQDLKRRGVEDEGKARLIAASTLLLPVLGGFAYCALRPELPED